MYIFFLIIDLLFLILRSLFIGFIGQYFFKSNRVGFVFIILYGLYNLLNEIPFSIRFFIHIIGLLISLFFYDYIYSGSIKKLFKRKKTLSLDIKTIQYEFNRMYVISITFIISLWLYSTTLIQFRILYVILINLLILGFNLYVFYKNKNVNSYVLIRVGKRDYIYFEKSIHSKVAIHRYQSFFQDSNYQLDYIAKVISKQDSVKRHDYVYAIKSQINLNDYGFMPVEHPYKSILDEVKSYQVNVIYINNENIKIKRIS